jgi:hypothetical protein
MPSLGGTKPGVSEVFLEILCALHSSFMRFDVVRGRKCVKRLLGSARASSSSSVSRIEKWPRARQCGLGLEYRGSRNGQERRQERRKAKAASGRRGAGLFAWNKRGRTARRHARSAEEIPTEEIFVH